MLGLTRSQFISPEFIHRLVGSHPTGTADLRLRRVVNSDRERRQQSRLIEIPTGTTTTTTALRLIFDKRDRLGVGGEQVVKSRLPSIYICDDQRAFQFSLSIHIMIIDYKTRKRYSRLPELDFFLNSQIEIYNGVLIGTNKN